MHTYITRVRQSSLKCGVAHYWYQTIKILWFHYILVWIRILIRRSVPPTNRSGSCYFHNWPSRRQQNTNLKKKFSCSLLFQKVKKKSQNSRHQGSRRPKNMWIQWIPIRIRIRIRKTAGDPKTYGSCGSESATLVVANTFTHLDSTGKGGGRVGRGGDRPF